MRSRCVTAEVHTNPDQVEQGIRAILRRMPRDARFYQVRLARSGHPDQTSVKQSAQVNVLMTILTEHHVGQREVVACSNTTMLCPARSLLFLRRKPSCSESVDLFSNSSWPSCSWSFQSA